MKGNITTVFQKVSALHSKNHFSLAIVTGDLFSLASDGSCENEEQVSQLLANEIPIHLPTYFTLSNGPLPEDVIERLESSNGEVCTNLYFLGKRTTITTSEGIRIVALGGTLDITRDREPSRTTYLPAWSPEDAKALRGAHNADILLTNTWPENVSHRSEVAVDANDDNPPVSNSAIAELCSALKPRYHFGGSGDVFYEREPFFHPPSHDEAEEPGYAITRFLSLASFGNAKKQKWIYAFSINPTSSNPITVPAGTTASPFPIASSRSDAKRSAPEAQSFSRFSQSSHHYRDSYRGRHKRQKRNPPPGPESCFFCLSNPNLATHLITSIGTEAYLTTAKGPLSTRKTFVPYFKVPAHILIIPLAHEPTLNSISNPTDRQATVKDMERYYDALNRMTDKTSGGKLGSVMWELNRPGGIHAHRQWIPFPKDRLQKSIVEAGFKVEAENDAYGSFKEATIGSPELQAEAETEAPNGIRPEKDANDGEKTSGDDTFKVWIWTPSQDIKTLTLQLPTDKRFDLQFGRLVVAKLLGLESRTHWRDACDQDEDGETEDAEAFKEAFKDFDFSLQ